MPFGKFIASASTGKLFEPVVESNESGWWDERDSARQHDF